MKQIIVTGCITCPYREVYHYKKKQEVLYVCKRRCKVGDKMKRAIYLHDIGAGTKIPVFQLNEEDKRFHMVGRGNSDFSYAEEDVMVDPNFLVVDIEIDPEDPVYYTVKIIPKEGEDNEQKV